LSIAKLFLFEYLEEFLNLPFRPHCSYQQSKQLVRKKKKKSQTRPKTIFNARNVIRAFNYTLESVLPLIVGGTFYVNKKRINSEGLKICLNFKAVFICGLCQGKWSEGTKAVLLLLRNFPDIWTSSSSSQVRHCGSPWQV